MQVFIFVEVETLGDGFLLLEKQTLLGNGNSVNCLGILLESCWGILRSLVTSLVNFGAVIGDFYSVGDVRTTDINRLHAENMEVTLQQNAPASISIGEGICRGRHLRGSCGWPLDIVLFLKVISNCLSVFRCIFVSSNHIQMHMYKNNHWTFSHTKQKNKKQKFYTFKRIILY